MTLRCICVCCSELRASTVDECRQQCRHLCQTRCVDDVAQQGGPLLILRVVVSAARMLPAGGMLTPFGRLFGVIDLRFVLYAIVAGLCRGLKS